MKISPLGATVMPPGYWRSAFTAGPPSPAKRHGNGVRPPAIVVMIPPETFRTRHFASSVKSRSPEGVTASPLTFEIAVDAAGVPSPPFAQTPVPATVETTPLTTTRIRHPSEK